MLKFPFPIDVSNMTVLEISKFISDYKAGSLKPFYKSEEIPE